MAYFTTVDQFGLFDFKKKQISTFITKDFNNSQNKFPDIFFIIFILNFSIIIGNFLRMEILIAHREKKYLLLKIE